jgi:hypothetical protein
VAGVVVALVLVAFGALSLVGLAIQRTERSTRSWAEVGAIDVDAGSGDVEVVAASRDDVQVEQFVRRTWRAPRTEAGVSDGVLRLRARCPIVFGFGNCSVDYRIQAPAGTSVRVRDSSGDLTVAGIHDAVDVRTGSGNVHVREVVGRVSAQTSSGDVTLTRTEGDVFARTSSGNVTGDQLASRHVEARTSSGEVRVQVVGTAPDTLTATSSSGDVRVVVPDEVYQVDAHTSSGNVDLSLRQDPASPRRIEARTSSGDVVVRRG